AHTKIIIHSTQNKVQNKTPKIKNTFNRKKKTRTIKKLLKKGKIKNYEKSIRALPFAYRCC
ncbi:hypothetical protein Q6272_33375, partial [Klebsiella pneumoniae]|uniref:hypothetical protein n=1 Tax=Klebsiella pneumoniae TaxID=573 RepID=UPI00272F9B26